MIAKPVRNPIPTRPTSSVDTRNFPATVAVPMIEMAIASIDWNGA